MAGIYLHIPYCKKKCHYCNFFSLATTKYRDDFLQALLCEIVERKTYLTEAVQSIYFGGGTPSLLSADELHQIFETIEQNFSISPTAEITLEANPDDLSLEYLKSIQKTKVNRLSIGIQSFFDEELQLVNRVHTGQEAIESVKRAREVGFEQMSLDLIYGIPNSTLKSWEANLKHIEQLSPTHLSAYSLTQEPQTAYDVLVKKGKLQPPSDDKAIQQYELLQNYLPQLNMEQYEISNYARDGQYALHNTHYWKGIPYLGLGPSAHSYNGTHRRWNKAHLKDYIDSADKGAVLYEEEALSLENKWNEWIMTGLRTKWGIDMQQKPHSFPQPWTEVFLQKAQAFIHQELLFYSGTQYFLTEKGKLFADGIAADFFQPVVD
jgi:oxygen-independent coproporphyrinogen-3 oxidase